ncbi:MAG: hypothetical protein LBC55_00435 [Desulfovibrio sp.]|jgi:hypothetical protein|nr:hypothetical protein [Desulfovibrio sp.]
MSVYNIYKYFETLHHIVHLSTFGIVGENKLRTLLWLCDKANYLQCGKTISHKIYIKKIFGPDPEHFYIGKTDFENEEVLTYRPSRLFSEEEREYISLREPECFSLAPEEQEIILHTVALYAAATLEEVRRIARCRAWEITELNKLIPMQAVLERQP